MVRRSAILLLVLSLTAAACSGGDTQPTSTTTAVPIDTSSTTTLSVVTTETIAPTTTSTTEEVEVEDEVIEFIAAIDELLIDTAYEDLANDDPEVFIATGLLFCEQLTEGAAPADLLVTYVESLTGGDIADADDDTLTLAGSILGTAVGYLCPEHTELIEEGL